MRALVMFATARASSALFGGSSICTRLPPASRASRHAFAARDASEPRPSDFSSKIAAPIRARALHGAFVELNPVLADLRACVLGPGEEVALVAALDEHAEVPAGQLAEQIARFEQVR